MPPPMPQSRNNPNSRMTANPLKPIQRYRPGKAVAEEPSSEEEVEDEEEQTPEPQLQRPKATSFPTKAAAARTRAPPPKRDIEPESDDEEGFVTDEEDDDDGGVVVPKIAPAATSTAVKPTPQISRIPKEETIDPEDDEEEEEESSEESSDQESSSSEEDTRRKFQRPTFIKKTDRRPVNSQASATESNGAPFAQREASTIADDLEEARRKEMADLMIKDKLERDAAARAAGKKYWDDDDELAPEAMVDDTDGLDPEAEYAAWKLRELKRLKRDREAIEAREKEIEEIERRKNLSKEERDAEDRDFLEKQAEERDANRGMAGFLAKYHHRGAFFQDDEAQQEAARRDLVGARYEDQIGDKSVLPKYMQVRDQNMVGKKGRTRYTDLRTEDTGRWGGYNNDRGQNRREGDFKPPDDTVDERFKPDAPAERGPRASGANASVVGERRKRSPSPLRDRDKRKRIEAS
ncbi:MAG: hypothetical protein Q9160_003494 [Pyrenula sp. 1 TL-2023]